MHAARSNQVSDRLIHHAGGLASAVSALVIAVILSTFWRGLVFTSGPAL